MYIIGNWDEADQTYAQTKGVIGFQPKMKYPGTIIFPKLLHCNYTDLLKMSNILSSEFNANIRSIRAD